MVAPECGCGVSGVARITVLYRDRLAQVADEKRNLRTVGTLEDVRRETGRAFFLATTINNFRLHLAAPQYITLENTYGGDL